MIRVVQQSLMRSILSNMLLVLGCALFSGGLVIIKKEQVFNKSTVVVSSGLLLMTVMGLLFLAVLHYTDSDMHFGKSEFALSRFISCIMLIAYGAYLFYQLKTQDNQYVPHNEEGNVAETPSGENQREEIDDEAPEISKWESIIWLAVITAWISFFSDYLVDAIEVFGWNID